MPVGLDGAHEADLDEGDQHQRQRIADDAPRDREVVQGAAVQHLRARLEPGAAVDVRAVGLWSAGQAVKCDAGRFNACAGVLAITQLMTGC